MAVKRQMELAAKAPSPDAAGMMTLLHDSLVCGLRSARLICGLRSARGARRPRPDKEKHKKLLQDVLKSFLDEDHMKQQAIVLVVNNSPMYGSHSALDEWTGQKRRGFAHVHVVDNPYLHAILDLAPAWGQNSSVSSRSKHHLLDVIGTLMVAYRRIPASSLYMFHEDDFVSCPGALQAIWRGINDANHYFCACTSHKTLQSHHTGLKAWRGIRFTHGMAGIVVPAAAIPSIALYMLQSAERVPVDHALVEWILGAGEAPWQSDLCPYFVVKENWFEHMGQSLSTFHGRRHVQGLRCGDQMTPIGIFRKGEAFDEKACATDRIYPCAASIQQERKEHSDLYDDVPPLESVLTLQQTRADALVERQLGKESMEVFLETEGIEDWTQERRLLLEKLEAQKALVRALEKESGTWKVLKDISKNRLRPDPPANRVKAWRESERPLWDAAHPPILPLPRTWTNGSVLISVSSSLAFSLPHPPREAEADVLLQAFARYKSIIFQQSGASESHGAEVCILKFIDVSVRDYSHTLDLETDESYELFIPETSNNDHCNKGGLRGSVQAKTQVGALRALETFSQLVFFDPDRNQYMIKSAPWSIVDAPRFQHREVLLDTSRHFFPLVRIKSLISAMSMAKFNVFHWHITDDQSFPLEVPGYPLLSRGAFSSMERYSAEDVKSVVGWGRLHGVRVVPEVDMPGHTRSWCKGYPDICPSSELACQMPLSPICPSVHTPEASNTTYQVVGAIITELSELFSDAWLHIGVDEVSTECWESSELVRKWMSLNNLNQSSALQQFLDVTASMVRSLGKTPVMWADAFMQAYLPKDVVGSVLCIFPMFFSLLLASFFSDSSDLTVLLLPADFADMEVRRISLEKDYQCGASRDNVTRILFLLGLSAEVMGARMACEYKSPYLGFKQA